MESEGQIYDWAIWADRYEDDPAEVMVDMKRAFQKAMDRDIVRPTKLVSWGSAVSYTPQQHPIWLVSVAMEPGHSDASFAEWWGSNDGL